jgi:hypothetical protein
VVLVVAVAGALTLEVVALHGAGEALAAADAGDVDAATGRQRLDRDLLADFVAVDRVDAELHEPHAGLHAGLGEVAGDRLGQLLRVPPALRDLQRRVPVALGRLDLDDAHGFDTEHRDGNDLVIHPFLRHPDLLAENHCLSHCGCSFWSSGHAPKCC